MLPRLVGSFRSLPAFQSLIQSLPSRAADLSLSEVDDAGRAVHDDQAHRGQRRQAAEDQAIEDDPNGQSIGEQRPGDQPDHHGAGGARAQPSRHPGRRDSVANVAQSPSAQIHKTPGCAPLLLARFAAGRSTPFGEADDPQAGARRRDAG